MGFRNGQSDEISRRAAMASTGAAAAALLAGCSDQSEGPDDSDADDTDDTDDVGGGGNRDRTFVTEEDNSPENVNYNRYDDTYFPGTSAELIFGSFYTSTAGQETDGPAVLPGLMKVEDGPWGDVSEEANLVIEDDEFILPLFEDYTWHDGDPVTARDVVTLMELERLAGANMWEPLENVEVVDDYAVRVETVEDVLEPLVIDRVVTTNMSVKHDIFEQFLPDRPIENMGPIAEDEERAALVQELVSFTLNEPEDVVGWGPFQLAERGQTETRLELYEDYPLADEFGFNEVEIQWYSAAEARQQHFIAGEFDGIHDTPARAVANGMPDAYEPYPYDTRVGAGLAFNYDHQYFGQREVRQAFAFALDREQMVANSGWAQDWVQPHSFDTGYLVGRDLHDQYFGEGFVDQLTHYEHDPDRATELLQEAGWSQDGGTWYDSNGDPVSLQITVSQTPGEWANMATNASQQLQEFGIDSNTQAQNLQIYYGRTVRDTENQDPDYDIAGWIVGEGRTMPYVPLRTLWEGSEAVDVGHNHPYEVEVPWPPGDPDNDLQTVNYREKLQELARTPEEESTELFQEVVWIYNQWMPVFAINRTTSAGWLHTGRWSGPDQSAAEASVFTPFSRLLRYAHVQPND